MRPLVRSAAFEAGGNRRPKNPPAVAYFAIALAMGPAFSPNLESMYYGLSPVLSETSLIAKSSPTGGSFPALAPFGAGFF